MVSYSGYVEEQFSTNICYSKNLNYLIQKRVIVLNRLQDTKTNYNAYVCYCVFSLAKFVEEMKEREEKEMLRIESESKDRIKEVKRKTEEMQAEHEEKHKQVS